MLVTREYPAASLLGFRAPERILTIRLGAVGDVVTVLPALAALHKLWPRAAIHHLVEEGARDVVTGQPGLEKIIVIPRAELKRQLLRGRLTLLHTLRAELREHRYDAVVDFQNLLRSAVWTSFTRAPLRIVRNNWRELSPLWFNVRARYQPELNVVHQHIGLLESLSPPGLQLNVEPTPIVTSDEDVTSALAVPKSALIDGPFTLLAPGSRWPARAIPEEITRRLCSVLQRRGKRVILIGGPHERGKLESLAMDLGVASSTQLGLKPLAALIARAELLVCADSAPLHIADMLRVPMLALFGPSAPELYGPAFAPFRALRHEQLAGQHDFRGGASDYFSWIDERAIEQALDGLPLAA